MSRWQAGGTREYVCEHGTAPDPRGVERGGEEEAHRGQAGASPML